MSNEIEHEFTDSIVCPYCGVDCDDSDFRHHKRWTCDSCGKDFAVDADYSVTYTTRKLDDNV